MVAAAGRRRRCRQGAVLGVVAALAVVGCRVPDPKVGDTLAADFVAPAVDQTVLGVAYGADPEHVVDLYLPAPSAGPAPVLVWFHIGGWMGGSRSPVPEVLLRQVSRTGWAVVSADVRRVRWDGTQHRNTHPAPVQDVDRLVRWLKVDGSAWNLDGSRIVLAGASSGAHLAAMGATAPGLHVDPTLPAALATVDPGVQGAVLVSGPLDLVDMVSRPSQESGLARTMLGCPQPTPCDPEVVRGASPVHLVSEASAPAFVSGGALDLWASPTRHAVPYHDALVAARRPADQQAGMPGVWLDVVEDEGHNVDHTTMNVRYLEQWLDLVATRTWSE